MSNTLEYAVEQLGIDLLNQKPALGGFTIYHADDNAPGSLEKIVCRAIQGKQSLEGCKPFEVELTMSWEGKASLGVPDTLGGSVADAMRSAIYNAKAGQVNMTAFQFISIEPESSGDRTDEPKSRNRQYKVPILAKLAA